MAEPEASRPFMPGYGVLGPDEGSGLLPWAWAEERLRASRNYWLVSLWPDGRPHCMPVWGVWDGSVLWFSSGGRSRKARNLAADPRCVVTTQDPDEPVVVEGAAARATDPPTLRLVLDLMNEKYTTDYPISFMDPEVNATTGVRPDRVFALDQADFTGSPTRWVFSA